MESLSQSKLLPGFSLQVLKHEVELMARMAKTIDGFTQHQTRLAVVIDGLDSCEQDKVLQMLDTVSRSHRRSVSKPSLCSEMVTRKYLLKC